ncbi:ELMO domain-containing protein 2-like [Liolophura sinensis]|uniref:ELMO domain-containing protein 2-like n=1 Tax=Liolophura sinensis TaxID=3198878 RepID=UPI0031588D62
MWSELWANVWTSLYLTVFRPMIKWLTHKITGKCELLRLIYLFPTGAERTKHIEKSLQRSRHADLKRLVTEHSYDVEEAVKLVVKIKQIVEDVHIEFESRLKVCLVQICAYKRLFEEVETIRKIKYDSTNAQHEKMLLELWDLLMPDDPLEGRISSQWNTIGFQGSDPATDFRGMGILGLQQLIYFAKKYSSRAKQCLSRSQHPNIGLSYAIVGVNITGVAHHLLKKRKLRSHFYNNIEPVHGRPTVEDFHEVYCYLFYEFDKFWYKERPKTIMEFSHVRDKFQKRIISQLKKPGVKLCIETDD